MRRFVLVIVFLGILVVVTPIWSGTITADFDDLRQVPAAKKLLDHAAGEMQKYAQGNESGISIKSARGKDVIIDLSTKKPVAGVITVVFDLHHRHRVTQDSWAQIGPVKTRVPGIIAYDRHDDILVEYDIKEGKGKARLAKGPVGLPLIPRIDWDLWVHFSAKK